MLNIAPGYNEAGRCRACEHHGISICQWMACAPYFPTMKGRMSTARKPEEADGDAALPRRNGMSEMHEEQR